MAILSRYWRLRLPRPKTFLGLMSLQTGAEMVTLALLFNKVTGVYGLLAILTGYSLSALQLSMYLYSVVALVVIALLLPHIRKQTPFQNLALAWLYLLDTAASTAYTCAFAISWYLTSTAAAAAAAAAEEEQEAQSGAQQGADAAGGDVTGRWWRGSRRQGDDDSGAAPIDAATARILGAQETATSIVLIIAFTLVRIYFSLVITAYARQVLRRFVENRDGAPAARGLEMRGDGGGDDATDKQALAASPAAVGAAMGDGWRRRLGTLMLSVCSRYWLGEKGDEEWTKEATARFSRGSRVQGSSGGAERQS